MLPRLVASSRYRGRFAPSPTGFLHLGHAATFWTAQMRAEALGGEMVLRIEDLDRQRCKPEFADALLADLLWFGFRWTEGPDVDGAHGPYRQRERIAWYHRALAHLAETGAIYPCRCTRQDVSRALSAPHPGEDLPVNHDPCRPDRPIPQPASPMLDVNWRFRVPDGELVSFDDGRLGTTSAVAGRDFGDFIVWRKDGFPAYHLAVVVDDAAMAITEVVRGADLLPATALQLLLYRALDLRAPAFYHCPLITDAAGQRLAKRAGAHSLRALRAAGVDPRTLRAPFSDGTPL